MTKFRLRWKGPQVLSKVRRCEKQGIDETMTDAVNEAKNTHPWQTDTGKLERSIRIVRAAVLRFKGFVGQWGSVDTDYAIFLELSDKWMWLRPAADKVYPNLARNIKRCMSRG